ncbi:CPBP family intramembrane glutamic endopeptidase [Corynebacterium durum]|uniref:CPBP family intramembrane glutamic endopeptidase n=1 Tax=Corynebacterium durum TaxID=61592 RepID=UPI0028E3D171|nr:CPBP family intramembrane glutamic endopeptidase [Corynebacterium durum]
MILVVADLSSTLPLLIPWVKAARRQAVGHGNASIALFCVVTLICVTLTTLVACASVWFLCRYLDKTPFSIVDLRLNSRGVLWFFSMIAVACIIFAITMRIVYLAGVKGISEDSSGDTWWANIILAFGLGFLLQAIPEEIIFRGWLIPSLGNTKLAVALSVVTFGVIHIVSQGGQQNLVERFIYLSMPLGFAFAAAIVRLASHSVWAAIGVHGGLHISGTIMFFLPNESSPLQWTLLGVLWVLVGIIVNWRYKVLENLA